MITSRGEYDHWQKQVRDVIDSCDDKFPNQFADRAGNERMMLSERLKRHHEDAAEQWMPNQSGVFANLINSALETRSTGTKSRNRILDDAERDEEQAA